jgi:hypothetical protein
MIRWLFVLFCVIAAVSLYMHFHQPPSSDSQVERGGPQLPPSDYELAKGGTVFVWRDLDTAEIRRERVVDPVGRSNVHKTARQVAGIPARPA